MGYSCSYRNEDFGPKFVYPFQKTNLIEEAKERISDVGSENEHENIPMDLSKINSEMAHWQYLRNHFLILTFANLFLKNT